MRELGPQGESAFWLEHFAAALEWRRGRYQAAKQRNEAALQSAQVSGRRQTSVQALGYCARGSLAIAGGELSEANSEFQRCARSSAPVYQLVAELGKSQVALFAGDHQRALQGLVQVQQRLAEVPTPLDRRGLKLQLLELWVRAGATEQAVPLLIELSDELAAGDSPGQQASLLLIKARLALLRGDLDAVSAALKGAERRAAKEDWQLQSSARLFAAYLDHARGNTAQAQSALDQLAADARRNQDMVIEVEAAAARQWIDPRAPDGVLSSLLAETGLRGIRAISPLVADEVEPASPL